MAVDTKHGDRLAEGLARGTGRRRAIARLGILALGGAGFFGRRQSAAAARRRCVDRCTKQCEHNDKFKGCSEQCRGWCDDRSVVHPGGWGRRGGPGLKVRAEPTKPFQG
jgi:hypothetical protein